MYILGLQCDPHDALVETILLLNLVIHEIRPMQQYLDFGSCGDALTLCSCRQKLSLLFLLQGMAGAIGISYFLLALFIVSRYSSSLGSMK